MEIAIKEQFESPLLKAIKSDKVAAIGQAQAQNRFAEMLGKIYFYAGQQPNGTDLTMLTVALFEEATKYFPQMGIGEIEYALNEGVRGAYGEYYGINIKTIHGWLRYYQVSEARQRKLKEMNNDRPFVVDRIKVRYEFWCAIFKQFKNYKETGKIEIPNALMMFKEFWNGGILKPTKEEAEVFKKQAIESFQKRVEQIEKAVNKREYAERLTLQSLIQAANENNLPEKQEKLINSKSAELCIVDYYDRITEADFETAINRILSTPIN